MVQRYEVRGKELGGDEFYTDWIEVVRYEDYAKLEAEHQKLLDAVIQYGHDPETLMELFKV